VRLTKAESLHDVLQRRCHLRPVLGYELSINNKPIITANIAHRIGEEAPAFANPGHQNSCTAGPTTRAPLNMEELSAIAFIKSSLPTIIHKKGLPSRNIEAFTTPSKLASTNTCQT